MKLTRTPDSPSPSRGCRRRGSRRAGLVCALLTFTALLSACSGSGLDAASGAGKSRQDASEDTDWRNWDAEEWARDVDDFTNPVIDGLWEPERMREARDPGKQVDSDIAEAQGVTDPEPTAVDAKRVGTPYHKNAAPVGKVFFDSPEGSQTCSGTVVKDPARPGRSNLVWTAGHCVHAGQKGGWFRNIVFVPSFNDKGLSSAELETATAQEMLPFGTWWADWAATSQQWISNGTAQGGNGAPFDFAVLHVKPAPNSDGRSLEETVGAALPVAFNGPRVQDVSQVSAWGYPAAQPFDGSTMHNCSDEPGRLSLKNSEPTMYRIGCTMTGGSSGGGWFTIGADGKTTLVSNTSIGPDPSVWLAGPYLGHTARNVFDEVSDRFAP